jgi:chemotaxis protein CheX
MAEPIAPSGKLDLSAVGSLHATLVERVGQDVVLDLKDVSHIGALCVQTCIAAARSAQDTGHAFRVINATDQVLGQIASMGLTPETLAEGLR